MDAGTGPSEELLQRLVDGGPHITMLVDGTGQVLYSSANVSTLFGYEPDEVLGTNIFDYLDVDFSAEAVDSIGAALTNAGLQRPMVFRLISKTGARPVVEVTANSRLDDPEVGGLMVYVRPWGERWLLDQVLEAIAGSAPLESTLRLLVDVMRAETLAGDGVLLYEPTEQGWQGRIAAPDLGPAQTGETLVAGAPWLEAVETGQPVRRPVTDLPDELAAEATARGHTWCWVWPVPGPDRTQACLVLWREADEDADHTCRVSMDRLVRLTELVLASERSASDLRFAANHDALTGLANRSRFQQELRAAAGPGGPGRQVGVLYLDLDGFKPINDEHGHAAGDVVLKVVSRRLTESVRGGDLVARLGGDEFTVLCSGVSDRSTLAALADRLVAAVAEPIEIEGHTVAVSASIGIAVTDRDDPALDRLVEVADGALYQAKREAPGTWRVAGD